MLGAHVSEHSLTSCKSMCASAEQHLQLLAAVLASVSAGKRTCGTARARVKIYHWMDCMACIM